MEHLMEGPAITIIRIITTLCALACSGLACAQGACCLDDGSGCVEVPLPEVCSSLGGTWMGPGTNCMDVLCIPGACCVDGFGCIDQTYEYDCYEMGGMFIGPDTECSTDAPWCEVSFGACCINGNECWDGISEDQCYWMGGEFIGADTDCGDAPWCVTYYGSCCFGDYCVEGYEENECEWSGGIFWIDPCDLLQDVEMCTPSGACCLTDGTCLTNVAPEYCQQIGGTYEGNGSNNCAFCLPMAACCFDSTCEMTPLVDCIVSGGQWLEGSTCADEPCSTPPPCTPDLDNDGEVGGSDLAILLSWWNSPVADLNGDKTVDGSDVTILLAAWGPCEG